MAIYDLVAQLSQKSQIIKFHSNKHQETRHVIKNKKKTKIKNKCFSVCLGSDIGSDV